MFFLIFCGHLYLHPRSLMMFVDFLRHALLVCHVSRAGAKRRTDKSLVRDPATLPPCGKGTLVVRPP
jgi:hypothetical protein